MKRLHRADLFGWSRFDESRNVDFHAVLWTRPDGNVVVDPLPLSPHDERHLHELGGARTIVLTNSDHVRAAEAVRGLVGAELVGPRGERDGFPLGCDRWVGEGDEIVPGLRAFELDGSKTPGELALLLDGTTWIMGDLVRAHEGGRLCLLPPAKLRDEGRARASVRRLLEAAPDAEAVLTGDGWPVFRDGAARLRELVA